MNWLVDVFYNLVALPLFRLVLWVGAMVNNKLHQRQLALQESPHGVFHQQVAVPSDSTDSQTPKTVWFHAASMGEFEQLRSVISRVHDNVPDVHIYVSLFSVSGLSAARRLNIIQQAFVIPLDTRRNMQELVQAIQPTVVVVNRYDVWPNMIQAIHHFGSKLMLVNATFPGSGKYLVLRSWIRSIYQRFDAILSIDAVHAAKLLELVSSESLLQSAPAVTVLPDTRVDTVIDSITATCQSVEQFRRSDIITLIIGSSWQRDEEFMVQALSRVIHIQNTSQVHTARQLRLIIVPHEPTPPTIQRLRAMIDCSLWSEAAPSTVGHLVVDSVGLLLSLYRIADAAFVGGGFGEGVHSVTEPGVVGMPIACGPNIHRSADAVRLVNEGVLTVAHTPDDLVTWLQDVVLNPTARDQMATQTRMVSRIGEGSADVVARTIQNLITPT